MLHTTLVRSILVCVFLAGLYTALPSEVAGTLLPKPPWVTADMQWVAGLVVFVVGGGLLQSTPIGKRLMPDGTGEGGVPESCHAGQGGHSNHAQLRDGPD